MNLPDNESIFIYAGSEKTVYLGTFGTGEAESKTLNVYLAATKLHLRDSKNPAIINIYQIDNTLKGYAYQPSHLEIEISQSERLARVEAIHGWLSILKDYHRQRDLGSPELPVRVKAENGYVAVNSSQGGNIYLIVEGDTPVESIKTYVNEDREPSGVYVLSENTLRYNNGRGDIPEFIINWGTGISAETVLIAAAQIGDKDNLIPVSTEHLYIAGIGDENNMVPVYMEMYAFVREDDTHPVYTANITAAVIDSQFKFLEGKESGGFTGKISAPWSWASIETLNINLGDADLGSIETPLEIAFEQLYSLNINRFGSEEMVDTYYLNLKKASNLKLNGSKRTAVGSITVSNGDLNITANGTSIGQIDDLMEIRLISGEDLSISADSINIYLTEKNSKVGNLTSKGDIVIEFTGKLLADTADHRTLTAGKDHSINFITYDHAGASIGTESLPFILKGSIVDIIAVYTDEEIAAYLEYGQETADKEFPLS